LHCHESRFLADSTEKSAYDFGMVFTLRAFAARDDNAEYARDWFFAVGADVEHCDPDRRGTQPSILARSLNFPDHFNADNAQYFAVNKDSRC